METILDFFSYTFIQRALAVGMLVSVCASLLGVNLVLKRYSMIGDGLSHVGFGSLAFASAFNLAPLYVSIPVVTVAAIFLLRLSESGKLKGDSAVALLSSSALAIGVITISATTGMNTDVYNYMFGSILSMSNSDVILSVCVASVVLVIYFLFYNKIFCSTFDESFAKSSGINVSGCNMLLAILTALTIVVGMRMMGSMLISSLIIFPALTAMRVCTTFKSVVICSAILSVICFFVGILVSFLLSLPTGACIVVVSLAAYIIFGLINVITKVKIKV